MALVVRVAITEVDAESIRLLRNSCRNYMLGRTARIGQREQKRWWEGIDRSVLTPYLYSTDDEDVGYGLLLRSGRFRWLSGGLLPSARGKRWGRILFEHLIAQCQGGVRMHSRQCRDDDPAA